jgi:hypothetical protein
VTKRIFFVVKSILARHHHVIGNALAAGVRKLGKRIAGTPLTRHRARDVAEARRVARQTFGLALAKPRAAVCEGAY